MLRWRDTQDTQHTSELALFDQGPGSAGPWRRVSSLRCEPRRLVVSLHGPIDCDQHHRRIGRAFQLHPSTPSAAARHHSSRRPPADFSGVQWCGPPGPDCDLDLSGPSEDPQRREDPRVSVLVLSDDWNGPGCRSTATPRCCTCRRQRTASSTISVASPASIPTGRSIGRPCASRTSR